MTAVNLAITLAAADMRVILVDADLHRPMVSSIFHVATRGDGFTGVLSGRIPIEGARSVPAPSSPRLSLLLARREHLSSVGLFDASRVRTLFHKLSDKADVIVIDSPPLPEVAEALELAAAVDAVSLAVRLSHTNRDRLNQLREMLARRGVSPVGLVVTTRRSAQAESPYDYGGDVTGEQVPGRRQAEPGLRPHEEPRPKRQLGATSKPKTAIGDEPDEPKWWAERRGTVVRLRSASLDSSPIRQRAAVVFPQAYTSV